MSKKVVNIIIIYTIAVIIIDTLLWNYGSPLIKNAPLNVHIAAFVFCLPLAILGWYQIFKSEKRTLHTVGFWIAAVVALFCVGLFAFIAYPILIESGTL